jgi:fructose-1,6-bisphosphatase/inositol monophosphatase family enzyme
VSIAYERRGLLEFAVVYDALKRELFVAASGSTNGRSALARRLSLDRAQLATAFPYDQLEPRRIGCGFPPSALWARYSNGGG